MTNIYAPDAVMNASFNDNYYSNLVIINSRLDDNNNNFYNNISNSILKHNYFKKHIVDEA
jgi:hypothetical protein